MPAKRQTFLKQVALAGATTQAPAAGQTAPGVGSTPPNRTPRRCGWPASKGDEDTVIGNHYTTRFPDAWAAAEYTAANLKTLESKTRRFAAGLRESTIAAASKDAAGANLSTLVTQVCFRNGRRRVPRVQGRERQRWMLPRQLHARLELRNGDRASVPYARPLDALDQFRLRPRRRRSDASSRESSA